MLFLPISVAFQTKLLWLRPDFLLILILLTSLLNFNVRGDDVYQDSGDDYDVSFRVYADGCEIFLIV